MFKGARKIDFGTEATEAVNDSPAESGARRVEDTRSGFDKLFRGKEGLEDTSYSYVRDETTGGLRDAKEHFQNATRILQDGRRRVRRSFNR